jgi:hypothetical protein
MLGAGLALALLAAAPATADDVAAAKKAVMEKGDYQTVLPAKPPAPGKLDLGPPPEIHLPNIAIPGAVAQALLITLIGVVLILILVWVVYAFRGYQRNVKLKPEVEAAGPAPDAEVVNRPLGAAEALAAAGRYAEAIHILLLKTLEALAEKLADKLPPALTSREILGKVALGARARGALSGLVGAVEVTHFGGTEPSREDYQACLEQFQLFAVAYQGRA